MNICLRIFFIIQICFYNSLGTASATTDISSSPGASDIVHTDTNGIRRLIYKGDSVMKQPGESKAQIEEGMRLFTQGIALSRKIHSQDLEAECLAKAAINLFENKDPYKGTAYYHKAIGLYRRQGDLKKEADSFFDLGQAFQINTALQDSALIYFQKAQQIYHSSNISHHEAIIYDRLAIAHQHLGKADLAITEYLKAETLYKSEHLYNDLPRLQRDLATLYWEKGNTQESLHYNNESLNSAKIIGSKQDLLWGNSVLGNQYLYLKLYRDALPYLENAFKLAKQLKMFQYASLRNLVYGRVNLGRTDHIITFIREQEKALPFPTDMEQILVYNSYGAAYSVLGNYRLANDNYLKMLNLFNTLKSRNAPEASSVNYFRAFYLGIAGFYLKYNEYEKARPFYEALIKLPLPILTPSTASDAHLAMFRIDSAAGDYKKAIQSLQNYQELHDSLFNATSAKQTSDLKRRYQEERQIEDIKVLKNQRDAEVLVSQKANLQKNIMLVGIAAVLTLATVIYLSYRNSRIANRQLQYQRAKIGQQNTSLQNLLKEQNILLSEKETLLGEKEFLIKEIHHRVKNNLQIIMSLLNSQSTKAENSAASEAIKTSHHRVQAITLIHHKLAGDESLTSVNIRSYIIDLLDKLNSGFALDQKNILFDFAVDPINIDTAQAVPVGLIINEAITNSIKYAFDDRGGKIMLTLKRIEEEGILLKIADNGKGIAKEIDYTKIKSLGFSIMRGLCSQLKGDFGIEINSGTTISIKFPLRRVSFIS